MKLFQSAIVSICLVFVAADGNCNSRERFNVQQQWRQAFGAGDHHLEFILKTFDRLFQDYPETRKMFIHVHGDDTHSPQFEAFSEKIFDSFNMLIYLLSNEPALIFELDLLRRAHAGKHIKPADCTFFGEELLAALQSYLPDQLDVTAWTACFTMWCNAIIP